MQQLFVGLETARALRAGPLGEHLDGFVEALTQTGYAQATIHVKVLVLAQLGHWLERRGLEARDLDGRSVGEFLRWRQRRYQVRHGAETTVVQLLDHLQSTGELAPVVLPETRGRAAVIEEQYATYLREERALARATLVSYLPLVDRFLADRFGDGPVLLDQIKADDVCQHRINLSLFPRSKMSLV